MSERHPIIAITGSSGAGTTSVTRTFQNIFRREGVNAAIIEGDSFHRFDRKEMKLSARPRPKEPATGISATSGQPTICSPSWKACFATYAATGTGKRRKYLHDAEEAAPYHQDPGTFTPWEDVSADTDLLFYEGLHGAVVTPEVNIAQHPDLLVGVVPVINLEWIQKLWRDKHPARLQHRSRDRHHPAPHARLRELHLPAVHAYACELPTRAHGRHLQPLHLA
jgi:phosphoribulokinase